MAGHKRVQTRSSNWVWSRGKRAVNVRSTGSGSSVTDQRDDVNISEKWNSALFSGEESRY